LTFLLSGFWFLSNVNTKEGEIYWDRIGLYGLGIILFRSRSD
jgi:hypothetical protein